MILIVILYHTCSIQLTKQANSDDDSDGDDDNDDSDDSDDSDDDDDDDDDSDDVDDDDDDDVDVDDVDDDDDDDSDNDKVLVLPKGVPPNIDSNLAPSTLLISSLAHCNQSLILNVLNGNVTCFVSLYNASA